MMLPAIRNILYATDLSENAHYALKYATVITNGQGILAEAMLGSTSRRVLRRCEKPVMVVRLPSV